MSSGLKELKKVSCVRRRVGFAKKIEEGEGLNRIEMSDVGKNDSQGA